MVYVRGHRTDYDTWAGTYGCVGWSYAELLPYFRRAEDQQRDDRGLWPWVRGNVTTIFHPTSSCAMGASDAAVCDPALWVRGDTLLTPAELPAEPATVSSP